MFKKTQPHLTEGGMEPRFFEDFVLHEDIPLGSRTITDADIEAFARVSGDFNPLHLDEEFARKSALGGRVAHGVLGLAAATGALSQSHLTRGTLVAFAGLTWNFRRPVWPNSTVNFDASVIEMRETSKPDRGLITLEVRATDSEEKLLQEGRFTFLVRRRE